MLMNPRASKRRNANAGMHTSQQLVYDEGYFVNLGNVLTTATGDC
jgi:hypothetical protein